MDKSSLLPQRGSFGASIHTARTHFLQPCNAHGLPAVSLVDTPGFMVGSDTEVTDQVRHVSRLFVVSAKLRVPVFIVVLRKGYGLGAMGLEGAVRLGCRKELEAAPKGAQRDALFQQLLASQHENGSAIPMATTLEIDAVIEPSDTRRWLSQGLAGAKPAALAADRFIDTW